MNQAPVAADWSLKFPPFLGHALTVVTLALGGLSSFHALKSDVVELRAMMAALVQTEAEHTRRNEADAQRLRDDLREMCAELRGVKDHLENK